MTFVQGRTAEPGGATGSRGEHRSDQAIELKTWSIEAEQSLLGGLLLDNGALELAQPLASGQFFDSNHRHIYAAICSLVTSKQQADIVTVFEHLHARKQEVGGMAYLHSLAQYVLSAGSIRAHAEIVRDLATKRDWLGALDRAAAALRETPKVADAVGKAQSIIADVTAASGHAPPSRPHALDFRALAADKAPARHWFRPGWLGTGVTLLAGQGGIGKSRLEQHEATAGALGRSYFAPECDPYKALIWNCEDDHDDLWRNQEQICEHEQVDMSELADKLLIVSRYGCENALMAEVNGTLVPTRLLEDLRQQVNDEGVDVLYLDNAAHVFMANHDDRTQVTQFINVLNGLVQGRRFGIVLACHVSRAQGSEFSGSVAWENAARMRWYLGTKLPDQRHDDEPADDSTEVRFLCKRKSNYSARDHVRLTMRNGFLIPDQVQLEHVGAIASAAAERRADEFCLAGFKSLCTMGIRATDGKTSPDYLPSHIVTKGLAPGFTKGDLGRAMNRLMGRGVFVRGVVGQHSNRSPKYGLLLKEEAP